MKQRKIIAIGLSLGVALNSLSVSAADVTVNQQNEEAEEFSAQPEAEIEDGEDSVQASEEKEDEALQEDSGQSEVVMEDGDLEGESKAETESEDVEDFSSEPEVEAQSEDLTAVAEQSEVVRVSGTCGENITFKLTNTGVLTLSGSGEMPTIEYDWKYYEPKCGWGSYISSIKKIVIEDGITSISQYSFYDCENLTEVSIPASVKAIGYEAFHWCHNVNKVMIDGLDSWCNIDFDNENSNPLQFGADLYMNGVKETQIKIPEGITEIKPYVFGRSWTNDETKTAITSIQLPDTVTSIGENAFAYNHLQSINIPNSVTTIGKEAFAGNDFSTIEVSENVNTINDGAFKDCKKLQKIKLPDTAQKLGSILFGNCIKLTEAELPQGIENITAGMFAGCSSLRQFSVPETVKIIEASAFSKCSNLTNIELPDQIHTIGNYAFNECPVLKEITLPEELECIGNSAFFGCKAVVEAIIPNKVTSIGEGAFRGCTSLVKITVPDTVTEIDRTAFYDCCMLEQFNIPENTVAIQDYTFYGCTRLSSVTFPEKLATIGESAFQNCSALETIVIPKNVTDIGVRAFMGCEKLENVTLSSQISKIAAYTFSDCKNLKAIELPDGISVIATNAFGNCSSISEVTIPESVVEIGSEAFQNCSVLRRVNFKGDAPQIGINAFIGVTADCYYPADNASYTLEITTQDFGGDLTWTYEGKEEEEDKYKCGENLTWNLTEDGKLIITGSGRMFDYSIDDYQYAPWYEDRQKITSIEIDDNVTYIGNYAFYMCNKITEEKTELPEKLEEIGEGSFKNCKIHSLDIPSMVTCVGKEAFAYSGLESVSLPSSLQYLSERMFAESHYLYDVTFSQGLKEIGKEAFYCCFGLKSVDIPEGVVSIADKGFAWCGAYRSFGTSYSCYNFTKVTLPSTLTTMGAGAFSNCQVLRSINIPEKITEIQDNTFEYCYNLSSIIIPQGIKKIGSRAFFCNQSLKTITFSWNAPEINSKAFDGGITSSKRDVIATCYYPSNNSAWTSSMLQNYGGKLTWVAKEMVKPSEGTGSGGSGSGGTGEGTGSGSSGSDSGTGSGSGSGGSGTGTGGESGSGSSSGGSSSGGSGSSGSGTGTGGSSGSGSGGSSSGGSGSSGSGSGESGNPGGTGTEKGFGFSAHSLTLNGDIGVNFYLELDDAILNDASAVMEMSVAGSQKAAIKVSDAVARGSQEVKDTQGNSHQCYKFTCNVYAKQMTDNITATLKTGSGTWKEVYSVQTYVNKVQDNSNEKLKNLANAMAVYGAYAQTLLGYNTNSLAGGSLGDVSGVTKDMLSEYEYSQAGTEENLSVYGSSLLLKEQTALRMYYQLSEGNITDYKFTIDGTEVQPVQSGNTNLYYVELNNIAAQDLEKSHVFTAGNITLSNYSALSYVGKALDSDKSSENNKKTAAALYLYWNAAEAYFS